MVLDCSLVGNLSGALFVVNTSNPECPSSVESIIRDKVEKTERRVMICKGC